MLTVAASNATRKSLAFNKSRAPPQLLRQQRSCDCRRDHKPAGQNRCPQPRRMCSHQSKACKECKEYNQKAIVRSYNTEQATRKPKPSCEGNREIRPLAADHWDPVVPSLLQRLLCKVWKTFWVFSGKPNWISTKS